jgi:hypothetical protein
MIGVNMALSLPSTFSLGSATAGQAFAGGSVNVSGGTSNYTWTVNGTTVPTNGTPVSPSNADSLTASSTGGNTLSIGGTPVSAETVDLNVSVQDATGAAAGPILYTVTVNPMGYTISGFVQLGTGSGLGGVTMTLTQGASTIQTVTTVTNDASCAGPGSSGCFTFIGVPNGTYTVTPSISGSNWAGATALFNPALVSSISVNNSNVMNLNFQAAVGYTVTGTVTNGSASGKTGTIYVNLYNSSQTCNNNGPCNGTAIPYSIYQSSGGGFTINGVQPGTYSLNAWLDNVGLGVQNGSNPTASISSFTVPASTPPSLTLLDATNNNFNAMNGPTISGIAPINNGVMVQLKPLTNGNNIEMPPRYHVQWSTSSTFATIAGEVGGTTPQLRATGGDQPYILTSLNANNLTGLTNSSNLYFRIRGENSSLSTLTQWTVWGCDPTTGTTCTKSGNSASPTLVTIGPATPTSPVTVSGTITYTGTVGTGAPLYVGCFDQNSGNIYGEVFATPSFPQAYSLQVSTGADCYMFVFLDNNNDGIIDIGDASDLNSANDNADVLSVTGPVSGYNITLPSSNSVVAVTTSHSQQQGQSNSDMYNVDFDVRSGIKLPVAVELTTNESNDDLLAPFDMAPSQPNQDGGRFESWSNVFGTPSNGDIYHLQVVYSDGSSDASLPATISTVLSAFATNLSLVTSGGSGVTADTPTFTWTNPTNPGNYTYQFQLSLQNGGPIWQIPGNNSKVNGFSSSLSTFSLAWPTNSCSNNNWSGSYSDPDGDNNPPSVCSLSSGTQYQWTVNVQDSNGNSAQMQTSFTTP